MKPKLAKIFKIAAIAFICIAAALGITSCSLIDAQSEAGGWTLVCAWVCAFISLACIMVSIIMGKGSTGEKAGKAFLAASPFMIALIVIGVTIFLGVVGFLAWLYVFAMFM